MMRRSDISRPRKFRFLQSVGGPHYQSVLSTVASPASRGPEAAGWRKGGEGGGGEGEGGGEGGEEGGEGGGS